MANQQFKDYITTRTEDTAPDIANDFLPIYDASATTTKKVKIQSIRTQMFASGSIDAGGLTSFEIPNSASPTVDGDGEIAVDTSVADFSHGIVKVFAGEELALVALPIAELTTPTDGHVIAYNATNDEFELVAPSGGGIGGSTGANDNRLLRSDGTGGGTLQASGIAVDDNDRVLVPTSFSSTQPSIALEASTLGFTQSSSNAIYVVSNGVTCSFNFGNVCFSVPSGFDLGFSASDPSSTGVNDVGFRRDAANVVRVSNGSTGGGAMQFTEMTAPSAPATNNVRIYAEDNGSGKTRLMALFPTGAAQQIAIEP